MDHDGDEPLHADAPMDEQQAREEAFADPEAFLDAIIQGGVAGPLLEEMMNEFQFPDDEGFDQDMMDDLEAAEEEEIENEEDYEQRPHIEEFSDDDDDALLDSTAEQVKSGKDIQGIPWSTTPWTRDAYRSKRNADYSSYYNCEDEVKAAATTIKSQCLASHNRTGQSAARFTFYRNWRRVRSTIVHFQLRNLLWPVTSHQILYVANNKIMQWQNQTRKTEPRTVVDLSSTADPGTISTIRTATGAGVNHESIHTMSVCTMCAKYGIVAAGGFGGELVVKRINMDEMTEPGGDSDSYRDRDEEGNYRAEKAQDTTKVLGTRVSSSENGITNAIDICNSVSGTPSIVCSNNDQAVRIFDASTLAPKGEFKLPWAVNFTAAHPAQGRVFCVAGDDPEAVLLDSTSGSKIATLHGHHDYSFAAAWHPDGNVIATGNQDLTTRVYDLRMVSRPLCMLRAHIGAIRSLRFSPDGRTLAAAEPADYVTLYDVANEYTTCQSLDVFGEIAGIGFSLDSKRFYTAVSDAHYASLVQLNAASGNAEDGGRSFDEQWLLDKGIYCRKK